MNLSLQRNLGNLDRMVRILIGLIAIYLAFFSSIVMGKWAVSILAVFGTFMIVEGWLGY